MKIIVLFGAPAVGKLTVAQSIADISDFKVFDNHKVIDLIEPIVGRGYQGFQELVYRTHINIVEAAAEANDKNIVTTFANAANLPNDVEFMRNLHERCAAKGADVHLVHLIADNDDLMARVSNESRLSYGKITDKKFMEKVLEQYDFNSSVDKTSLVVNTSTLKANEAAQKIVDMVM